MKTTERFRTEIEAQAFVFGLNYVGDIDVASTGPNRDENTREYIVKITVGEDDEDVNEDAGADEVNEDGM
jgi:hypothetical protein